MKGNVTTISTVQLVGTDAVPIAIEVARGKGLPSWDIIGVKDNVAFEVRAIVRAALASCGYRVGTEKYVVTIAPCHVAKDVDNLAFAVAVGFLSATGQIRSDVLEDRCIMGSLDMAGNVRPARGMYALASAAARRGKSIICSPDASELAHLPEVDAICVSNLSDMRHSDWWDRHLDEGSPSKEQAPKGEADLADYAFSHHAIRALAIAAAGGHNLMLQGTRGSHANDLAERIGSILPPLGGAEQAETACVHSTAGLELDGIFRGRRPVRMPHHSITGAGLVGGGRLIHPGEVSLAHNGMLVMEDIQEWSPNVLQLMRQPMRDKAVTICRADGRVTMPADFTLIATCGTCPCGRFGNGNGDCTCSESQIRGYNDRIAGPLREDLDLWVQVGEISAEDALSAEGRIDSAQVREMVMEARERATRRDGGRKLQDMTLEELVETCGVSDEVLRGVMATRPGMTDAELMRLLRVSRTITDLDGDETVTYEDLTEALVYTVSI